MGRAPSTLRAQWRCHLHFEDRVSLGRGRTASVAVIWRGEYGDHVLVVAPVVALHDQLVRPRHQVEPVGVVELLADVLRAWYRQSHAYA